MRPNHFRSVLLIVGILVVLPFIFGALWLLPTLRQAPVPVRSDPPSQTSQIDTALPPADPIVKRPKKAASNTQAAIDSEETWDFNLSGQPLSIKLALDEAALRGADGKDSIARLSPPATQETLPARLAELSAPGGVLPVAYLAGKERSVATRRIVTPKLRVKIAADAAEKVAFDHDLVIKDRPAHAPSWVIMNAASPFAALDAMINLRSVSEVASADVLLAVQHIPRALPNDALIGNQWHLKKTASSTAGTDVNIETIWNYPAATGSRGAGVRIGIVDDGLQLNHPDLVANVSATNHKDWNGNDSDPSPETGDDHGTACAGNAAARGNNTIGVSGTAPLATLVGMRLISAATTDDEEAEAMDYLSQIIEIKSNSWGPSDTGNILEEPGEITLEALATATSLGRGGKGNILLWAAGNGGGANDNSNYDGYANSIYTIAIGAINSAGNRSSYSERGSNLIVCAPSNGSLGITTVDRSGSVGYSSGDYTSTFGGTSSATPTAAGIVALMLEENPNLGWRDVQEILIRSAAKFKPTDSDWVTNGAGIPFNHNFGAGLIDATAAVNLASSWTNLAAQTTTTSTQSGLSVAIPENNATGATRTFNLSSSNIRVEHVTLKLSASHTARGNLEVTLTSPAGMASKLAEVHSDFNPDYTNWTFSTVRNWGELSTGTWTLKIADRSATNNDTGGTLNAAELTIYGTAAAPVNPAPVVQITQPTNNQVFSIGSTVTVNVSANDLTLGGAPGTVSQVRLYDNDVLIGSDSASPYSFILNPSSGSHSLVAEATDSEGAIGTSVSIAFSVVNQPPVITSASLSASGQIYADVPLTVSSIIASDPENQTLSYAYQWQSSINQTVFADVSGATTATAPATAGTLLRCVVTASDGTSSSLPFTTEAVNLLARPGTTAQSGDAYTYTSGLILRGSDSPVSRAALIHEFSQGPASSSSEWIEILTLRSGSLAYWDIQDAAGNILVFADDAVWDDIPAGTLIVIYNGASKDPLLPTDDLDASDGRMVIASTNATYFDLGSSNGWPPLNNAGDAIFLNNEASEEVHAIAYGNSGSTAPNIGNVGSAQSASYHGDSDAGADIPANWRVTTALTARSARALLPGVTLSGGSYSQNFNTTPGASGTAYPDGWAAYSGTTQDNIMSVGSASSTAGSNYNYVSRIGLLGSDSAFDPSSLVLALANTSGLSGMTISFDIVKIREQGRSCTFNLEYSTTSPTAGFIAVPGATYTSGTIAANTVTSFTNIALPAAINNSSSTVFLRWYYISSSSGSRDGIALDNVVVSSSGPVSPPLTLTITPTTFAENLGASAATGTASVQSAPSSPLVVTLASSDTSEATLPATVTIAAGQTTSPPFAVTAVDDSISDGSQTVTLTATAVSYTAGSAILTVTDNDPNLEGVTPGGANSPVNLSFVTALRNGSFDAPALFRIGAGASIPLGLTLNDSTGVLSGTISTQNAAGDYLIIIERYNTLGETVSQSFTLSLSSPSGTTYQDWILTQNVGSQNGFLTDADGDGLANGIENYLGTPANTHNIGLTQISASPNTLVLRHSRSNSPASDLTAAYEWSLDLVQWRPSAGSVSGTTVTIGTQTITDTNAPATDLVEVTATVSGIQRNGIFLRIKSVKP